MKIAAVTNKQLTPVHERFGVNVDKLECNEMVWSLNTVMRVARKE